MITQSYLDTELALAKKIFMYYTDKTYDYLVVGSDRYLKWYLDSCQLYYLLSFLEAIIIDTEGIPYIGYFEVPLTTISKVFDKVREYYTTDCDAAGEYGTPISGIITPPNFAEPFVADWKELIYPITTNNTTTIVLPFTYTNIDPDTLMVIVEGYGAIKQTEVGEGFHIVGNTLYWHHYFNLDAGANVHFRYKQIVG